MNPIITRTVMILVCVILAGVAAYFFMKLPIGTQKKKIKEWLLWAVTQAEKELGSGTGQLKLRYVYDLFVNNFKFVSVILPFETFSKWVDEVLVDMKKLIATNTKVDEYVNEPVQLASAIGFATADFDLIEEDESDE